MKKIKAKSKIGAGLFTDDPLEMRVEFDGGWAVELKLMPLTQDLIVGLHKEGIKFQDYESPEDALDSGSKIFNRIVIDAKYFDPDGGEHPLDGKYKDRLMQLPDVMSDIFAAAAEHGATIYREDEKNSES